ncbi:MAG: malonyl-CoA synthase [Gammaproteobacteria bacterium]|nr:malonyl-CoA synthase [Gammaproteobacteria bacterium]MDH3432000.1 malonyl-CoA synthase [Gammaproteobacteria bacterium]MDH3433715.1 malonyl-CoA synthase [Gammaproteobacteria bacterium]
MSTGNSNLYARFRESYAGNDDKVVLTTTDGATYSFADIHRQSAQIAELISSLGVERGDRVSVQVRKSPQNLCLYLACLRGGFVYHPLNLGYKSKELEYFIGNAEPALVVCDSENEATLSDIARSAGVNCVYTLNGDGSGSLTDASKAKGQSFETVNCESDDLAALLYSSGTTGVPKGIMLSHGNLLSNTETLVDAWGFTADDRLLHALPIFHVHGLFVAIGCVLLSGASMRWLSDFDAGLVRKFLPECTSLMGVPTFYTRLLADPSFSDDDCRNIRLFVSGSAPLLEETFVEFEARTGHTILERYGMTETNMNTSNPLHGSRKAGTVGPPLPGVDVRITNDEGEELPIGETGNLQVRGPNVFVGYWRMPEKTAGDFTDDGFFNTGDMGVIDGDGYVSIVGRAKDLVITGGLNVYPKEVELFIDDIPGVKESAVIGVPHADFGEGVVAVVVQDGSAAVSDADIIGACRENLANFKVPKKVVFVDELPRNTMAKVQKQRLRETYEHLLD